MSRTLTRSKVTLCAVTGPFNFRNEMADLIDMHVRRAGSEDREQLLELWERSVRASHHFLSENDVAALRPFVAEELASDAVEWWVLLSGGETLAGFMGYTPGTIEALFIDPQHQGSGGGKLLVAHAQSLSGGALIVDVNEQNEAALRFYLAGRFSVVRRSQTDGSGRPFPLLHMSRAAPARPADAELAKVDPCGGQSEL